MIDPKERRRYMMEIEDRQQRLERPVLDEDKLNEMSQTLGEAIERGVLVTLTVFKPTGYVEVDLVPQKVVDGKLPGVDREGSRVSVLVEEIVDISIV